MKDLLTVKGLCKSYPGFLLRDVSFSLPGGTIMGFVGENGAGKTTTLKAILGLLRPDAGEVTLLGCPAQNLTAQVKEQVGVVFDDSLHFDGLTCKNIDFVLKHLYKNHDSRLFCELCGRFGLPMNKLSKDFSRGMKMKLSIAAALAHRPRLLLLDEATSGLDPIVRDEMLDVFLEFIQDEEHSILFSSHITIDLEKIADHVTFLHKGQVVFSKEKDLLMENYGIARCRSKQAEEIAPAEYAALRRTAVNCELLVTDRQAFARRRPDIVVDPASLEDIMLLYVKGETR